MTVRVCSLACHPDQEIPPGGGYTLLRFPYDEESADSWGMHSPQQPDGSVVTDWATDDRSGLIWPALAGWGELKAAIHWESGDYTELRDCFMRDPLGTPDGTAYEHRTPGPGGQYFTKAHGIYTKTTTPLGVMVRHNDTVPRRVTYCQFKLAIQLVEEP